MANFPGKRGDRKWGTYDFPVTRTQKEALEGLWHMFRGLPRAYGSTDLPQGGYYSQHPTTGAVLIGLHHNSVSVHRSGRITPNKA